MSRAVLRISIVVMELQGCQGLDYSRSLRAPPSHLYLSMFEKGRGSTAADDPEAVAVVMSSAVLRISAR